MKINSHFYFRNRIYSTFSSWQMKTITFLGLYVFCQALVFDLLENTNEIRFLFLRFYLSNCISYVSIFCHSFEISTSTYRYLSRLGNEAVRMHIFAWTENPWQSVIQATEKVESEGGLRVVVLLGGCGCGEPT